MGDYVAPPMGLAHLASVIEEEGHELHLVDCNGSNISWAEVPDIIRRIRPQVVGATAHLTSVNPENEWKGCLLNSLTPFKFFDINYSFPKHIGLLGCRRHVK